MSYLFRVLRCALLGCKPMAGIGKHGIYACRRCGGTVIGPVRP